VNRTNTTTRARKNGSRKEQEDGQKGRKEEGR